MSARRSGLPSLLIAAAFLTISCETIFAGEINWSTDIEGSLRAATASRKPVLLEFTAPWCVYCKRMEKTTFTDDKVAEYVNARFIAVRVDADQNKQLVNDLGIKGLPAILIVSPELQVMERIPGFQTPEALMSKLTRVPAKQAAALAGSERPQPSPKPPTVQQPAHKELEFEPVEIARPADNGRPAANVRPVSRPDPRAGARAVAQSPEANLFELEQPVAKQPRPAMSTQSPAEANVSFASEPAAAKKSTPQIVVSRPESEPVEDEEFFASLSKDAGRPEIRVPKTRTPASRTAAFEGTCIVSAVENREISLGSPRHQLNYRGQLLFFASEESKQKFEAQPNDYWPMLDGICAITLLNDDQEVQGQLEYAAFYRKRLWVFSSEDNMNLFLDDPAEVIEEVEEIMEASDQ